MPIDYNNPAGPIVVEHDIQGVAIPDVEPVARALPEAAEPVSGGPLTAAGSTLTDFLRVAEELKHAAEQITPAEREEALKALESEIPSDLRPDGLEAHVAEEVVHEAEKVVEEEIEKHESAPEAEHPGVGEVAAAQEIPAPCNPDPAADSTEVVPPPPAEFHEEAPVHAGDPV